MRLFLSLATSIVLLLVLPLYAQYIYELVRAGSWKRAIPHGMLLLLTASGVFLLGWYGLAQNSAAAARTPPTLLFLDKRNWEEELDLRRRQNHRHDLGRAMHIIKVKFDQAEYAQQKSDFDRALVLYQEIAQGSDENGSFETFESASIKNNMAVSYFKKQGDKGFKASSLFFDAIKIAPVPAHLHDVIQRNIEELDRFLNQ